MCYNNRRGSSRLEIKKKFESREEFAAEWEKNISKGGIFLKADQQPQSREKVTVSIEVPDAALNIELPGEAVHISPHGVGIQLDPLSDETRDTIKAALSGESEAEDDDGSEIKGSGEVTAQSIMSKSRSEKLGMGRRGGTQTRAVLLRDRDPQVVMNVLLNPRVTVAEVIQLTSSKALTLDMIKIIIKKPEWLAVGKICLNLVLHPKTPLPTALSLLDKLPEKDVRMLAKRPIRAQIKSAALKKIIPK